MPNPQIWNAFASSDAELTRLVEEASATVDADAQAELWRAASAQAVDLGWTVPVVSADSVFVASPSITGIEVDAATLSPKATEIGRPAEAARVEGGLNVIRIVIRRLLWSIPLLFVVSALLFVLVSLVPGDAALHDLSGRPRPPSSTPPCARSSGSTTPCPRSTGRG